MNLTGAELAHLKHRLVRAEKGRADLAARLGDERRRHVMEAQGLSHARDTAELENSLLRQEVERLRMVLGLPNHLHAQTPPLTILMQQQQQQQQTGAHGSGNLVLPFRF